MESVTVTAYCMNKQKTASGKTVKHGHIAVSHDLFKKGWKFGKKIEVRGIGIFVIEDKMHRRKTKSLDVYMSSQKKAKIFGKRKMFARLVDNEIRVD
jgi:3D (Asp-Asp-Asp) domain-containing protein